MRVAVCISGLPRFPEGYKSLKDFEACVEKGGSVNGVPQLDYYIYLWDVKCAVREEEYANWLINNLNIKQLKIVPQPFNSNKDINNEVVEEIERKNIGNTFPVKPHNVYCMWKGVYECNKLVKDSGIEYDVVIRSRTDLLWSRDFPLELEDLSFMYERGEHLCIPNNTDQFATETNSGYKGKIYNDQFALGLPHMMDKYAEMYKRLDHLILAEKGSPKPLCSESLLYTHIQNQCFNPYFRAPVQLFSLFPYWGLIRHNDKHLVDNKERRI